MSTPTPTTQYDNLVSDYDHWFVDNAAIVASEFHALRQVLPNFDNTLEVGVGTGFSQPSWKFRTALTLPQRCSSAPVTMVST